MAFFSDFPLCQFFGVEASLLEVVHYVVGLCVFVPSLVQFHRVCD